MNYLGSHSRVITNWWIALALAIVVHVSVILIYTADPIVRTTPYGLSNLELEIISKEQKIEPLAKKKKVKKVSQVASINDPVKEIIKPKIAKPRLAPSVADVQSLTNYYPKEDLEQDLKNDAPLVIPKISPVRAKSFDESVIRENYLTDLAAWLQRHKHYPAIARRRGQEGRIIVKFEISADGTLLTQEFVTPSSHRSLNRAVSEMLNASSPMPPVPIAMRGNASRFEYTLPVVFELN